MKKRISIIRDIIWIVLICFYLCIFELNTIIVPPRITPFSFGEEIQEGMRVQSMCTSTQGDQPFNITWFRDNKMLKAREQQDQSSHGSRMNDQQINNDDKGISINIIQSFSSVLTIHNITSQHNGNYTCQISNSAGVVDFTSVLSVAGK